MSRLYAERNGLLRRWMGAEGERLRWMALDVRTRESARREVKDAARPHFADLAEFRSDPRRLWMELDAIERMIEARDRCLVVRVGAEVVYRAFVLSDPARVERVVAPRGVRAPAWVVSGVMTHPAFRGRGIHGAAMDWLAAEARRAGVRYVVVWVAAWNRSSRRAFERAGFQLLERAEDPRAGG